MANSFVEQLLANTRKAVGQMNKPLLKDEPKLWLANYTLWICPICGDSEVTNYAGVKFVQKHHHPIRRYLTGHASYGKWLSEYYATLHELMAKQKERN